MSILTIKSDNFAADKEVVKAQKQWEQAGTVTHKYLTHVLGDISKGVSVVAPRTQEKKCVKKKNTS